MDNIANLPTHVGVIMDGNRRWAKSQGLPTFDGHQKGYNNLRELVLYALKERGVKYLSAFVFSTENWSRAQEEVGYLMNLVLRALKDHLDEFHRENVRIVVMGTRDKLKPNIIAAIEKAESTTKRNTGGTVALCFNYGGQQEIVDAAKKLLEAGANPANLTIEDFAAQLYHPDIPPLDLVIRTSGEQRLSGFMLWRSSYAEFLFMEKHWPEFTKKDIDFALDEYSKRQRRYGA